MDNFTIASTTVTVAPSSSVAPMAATVAPMATALPDVIVTSLSYSKGIFTCTVKNQGTAATPAGVIVGVKYSEDGVGKTWGNFMGPLAKGASVTIGTAGPAYTFPDGTHTITAYVDDLNRFKESNETNNKLSGTLTVDTTAPTVPSGLSAVAASSTQINLSWKASTDKVGVAGYKIFRDGLQVGTSGTTTYSDMGLTPITSYNYTVSAYDKAGNTSGKSTSVTAKTKRDYRFDGSISLPVLQNYLSRALHMMRFGEGVGDSTDNIRMITNTGAKYLGRAFHPFGYEDLFISRLATTRDMIVRTHAADPDIIFEGGMFEYASTKINTIAVPAWVFQAFNLPVRSRNFIQANMVFPKNPILPNQPYTLPDITKTETQMWFYYQAVSQINAGLESLNWGYYAMYASKDAPNYPILYGLVAKVRAYAKIHSRRHWVLMNAGGSVSVGGKLMFDFSGSNLHGNGVTEVTAQPCKVTLNGKYNNSGAGITPSGWSTTRLPFLVHIDNRGFSGSACTAGKGGSWLWGWDEISWFANQSETARNAFLRYANNYVNNMWSDHSGHLEMPGIRIITPAVNGTSNYFANSRAFYSLGFNQEETIRQVWSLDP